MEKDICKVTARVLTKKTIKVVVLFFFFTNFVEAEKKNSQIFFCNQKMGVSEYVRNEAQIIEARKHYREGHTQPSFVASYGTVTDMRRVMHNRNTYHKHEMIYILSVAAACNNMPVVKCLVEEFHMPVRSEDGTRALDAALCNLNHKVAEYLISKGADTSRYGNYTDKLSESPTAATMCLNPMEYHLADHLRKAMGRNFMATTDVIREFQERQRKTLLVLIQKCGMDVNRLVGVNREDTLLMKAMMYSPFEHVDLLMSLGADPSIVTPQGESLFHIKITDPDYENQYKDKLRLFREKYGRRS